MSHYALRALKIGKRYRIGKRQRYRMVRDVLRDAVASAWQSSRRGNRSDDEKRIDGQNYIWALKDVSFDLEPGDTLGIVGNNGAGKSTLLKIFSRITTPTEGYAHLRGRVGSLLEVGTGFHPELTGQENIYLNGGILGMRKREIDRKFDEIVDFSEVEKFLDTPVKFYSSGMRVRLAFSVAAHLDPEILLIDEVLAVGDIAFQKKSIRRMEEVTRQGKTVIFVSHNMAAIRSLCQSGLYLHKGKVMYLGTAHETVDKYLASRGTSQGQQSRVSFAPDLGLPVQILSLAVQGSDGKENSQFSFEKGFSVVLQLETRSVVSNASVELNILDKTKEIVLSSYDFEGGNGDTHQYEPGVYTFEIKIPPILAPGEYSLSAHVINKRRYRKAVLDSVQEVCAFELQDSGSTRLQLGLPWSGKIATAIKWERTEKLAPNSMP